MDVRRGTSSKGKMTGGSAKQERNSSCILSGNLLGHQTTHQNLPWLLFLLIFNWNLSSTSSFCPPLCSCDDVALLVDCHSAGNLRVVPIFLNPQIKFLSLARNQIKDVALSLQFYSELQVLDISQNVVETLGTQNFEILRNLRVLNVSYNSIKVLENGVFAGLTRTEIVDLQGNQMERIEREIFWSMESVREIILDKNRLEFLDWDLFRGLDNLEKISARFNFIQVIEPSQSFVIGGGGSNLGGSSWTLKNVRVLDVSWNQLTRVKDHSLVIFGALKELNLCCNYIHTLEEKAFSPGQLERVNLSQNRLGRVPTDALEKVGSSLRQLDLSSNRISDQIPKNAFRSLVHIETIRVSDNPGVHLINRDALIDNTRLITFEADYLSNLTQLSAALLTNKPFLQTFSLKYAQISSLSEEFFDPPASDAVKSLDLTGNPTDCNCSAFALFQFLNKANTDYDMNVVNNIDDQPHPLQITDDFNNYINSNSKSDGNYPSAFISSGNVSRRHLSPNKSIPKNTFTLSTPQFPSHLFSIRCQQPDIFAGILVKDLKRSDFEHCFSQEDHFQIMVICIAAAILFLIFLTLGIKMCCVCGLCTFCRNKCCSGHKKEKPDKPEKLFDSMIVLRRDLPPTPNFNASIPNGKSALGTPTHMLFCNGNGNVVNGNGNGTLPMGMPMDFNGYQHHHQQQHTPNHVSRPLPQHQLNQMSFSSPQKQIHQHQPPVILHYEYPDFPSMHRVKQVPSVLV